MSEVTLFGIANCDQVRKARRLLEARGVDYRFHDFRRDGLSEQTLYAWMRHLPWDALLNRRGRTWRELDEGARKAVVDERSARDAMMAEPTLVKRPVLVQGDHVLVGFSMETYERWLDSLDADGPDHE
ncbi:MAG: ArsC family reductase [Burkholderiaceae bacterium]